MNQQCSTIITSANNNQHSVVYVDHQRTVKRQRYASTFKNCLTSVSYAN